MCIRNFIPEYCEEKYACLIPALLLTLLSVISPNGNLVAYSTPANMVVIRDQAALISMAWRGDPEGDGDGPAMPNHAEPPSGPLRALTVELGNTNVIARAIVPDLILVMLGGAFPGKRGSFKLTKETLDDPVYPTGNTTIDGASGRATTLQLQRRKADTLADFIENEWKRIGMTDS